MRKWWEPSGSKGIEAKPWLAPRVIEKLESIIKPTFRVLEHGCGGSTLWFSERVIYVIATDPNQNFRDEINKKLNPTRARVFASLGELHALDKDKFDLLLIDGDPPTERARWLNSAPYLVKSGGWVVLDNANRPEYSIERVCLQYFAESYETFNCNEGGTLYLVTEFYRLK